MSMDILQATNLKYGAIGLPAPNRRGGGVENLCHLNCQFNGKIIRPDILLKYTTVANRF